VICFCRQVILLNDTCSLIAYICFVFAVSIETGALNRSVKRNAERFPEDFMFQITNEEAELLRCQFGISKSGRGGRRYLPYAFFEAIRQLVTTPEKNIKK